MSTNFQIWGTDGWSFLVRFLGGGDLKGITSGWGYNLAAVRALNAAIRAENRADRRQCWENGHFVSMIGKCVDDPEVGVAKALAQLNGDTRWDISDTRRQRLEGYVANQFYREWENAVESGEGSSIQGVIDKYGQYSDLMSTNPFIGGMSFSLMDPQNVLDRMILGENDWGVTVQMCTTTVTTNCVDPKNIKDIWEDFGRHVQVIFKGLEIPGLPDWLPFPGIMRLPTIGEIWDKISGPFNDAAREQMRDCMSKDDDGDGVANTASYCMENRDIAGIITQGILDGAGEIVDATVEKVGEIVDKALEPLDCVVDPAACAGTIKDTIEGILGGADPTQPGLPDWMRVIIIGSQYGDEVLKELEKIFNDDINGDGTIGILPTQEYCADGVTIKEDAEGTNCPEYAPFGYCQDGTTKKTDEAGTNCAEYAPNGYCQDGTTIKSDAAGTNCPEYSEFGYCQDGTTKKQDAAGTNCAEYAEFGYCEDGTTKKKDSAGTNCSEYTPDYGMCDDGLTKKEDAEGTNCPGPEPEVNPGDPCDLEDEKTGSYQYVGDELQCLPDAPEFGFCQDGVTEKADTDGTNCPEYAPFGYCQDGTTKKDNAEGTNCTEYSEFGYCQDGTTKKTDAQGSNCSENIWDGNCTSPQPDAAQSFAHQEAHRAWEDQCGETHCPSGTPKSEDPYCGQEPPSEEMCPNGDSPALHIDNDCSQPCRRGLYDFGEGCVSLTEVCTDPQTDEEYRVCGQHEQCGEDTDNPGKWVKDLSECNTPDDPGNEGDECTDAEGNKGVLVSNEKGDLECKVDTGTPSPQAGDDCPLGDNPTGGVLQENPETGELVCVPKGGPPRPDPPKPVVCDDRNATNYGYAGECGPCRELYDRPEGYDECVLIETLCQDPQYAENNELCRGPCADGEVEFVDQNGKIFCSAPCPRDNQIASSDPNCIEPCPNFNGVEGPRDDQGNCYDCTDPANAMICGWAECPDGISMAPTLEDCEEIDCTDPANAMICGWVQCEDGTMAPTLGDCEQETPCSDFEYASANPLECGWVECPDGSFAETREDCKELPQECANGATDYPACTTCPEGQSMDAEGNCVSTVEPPETGGDGGGGGGGMMGAFTPFLAGISYTPQAVPEPPAPPQKDYMAELDNLIKRSLFEGMA